MARALSQLVTVIRGSVGGVTFTANQWHQILLRARTAPVQPQTVNQSLIKDAFNAASEAWKAQTPANQELWRQYGLTVTYTGPMGEYTLPGRQIFMAAHALNKYLIARGFHAVAEDFSPPEISGRKSFDSITMVAPSSSGTGIGVSLELAAGEDVAYLIEHSQLFSDTRQRFKGPFLSADAVGGVHPAGTSAVVNVLGLVEGGTYFLRIRGVVNADPARLTKESFFRFTAVTTI